MALGERLGVGVRHVDWERLCCVFTLLWSALRKLQMWNAGEVNLIDDNADLA